VTDDPVAALRVLVVNAGSSSLKLRVVEGDEAVAEADLPAMDLPAAERGAEAAPPGAFREAIESFGGVAAVGHRVVHGGADFTSATRIEGAVMDRIAALADLAPLHQPASIAAWRCASALLPDVPHVACFDTAFHAGIPPAAATYALPRAWRERWPIRRFGFHGLSHAYAARRASQLLGRTPEELRLVTAHLGAGASLAAVVGGRSVDTTMGFTPLEGLVMATRSGSVDPGLVLWLQQAGRLPTTEVAQGLEHESGLQGLAGQSDMRRVLRAADAGDRTAVLARDVYVHRLRAGIGAMAASARGIDALVFTGGVGENAPAIRARTIEGLGFLGLRIELEANQDGHRDRAIDGRTRDASTSGRVLVVESREDLEIARQVRELLGR
jgi:acetate kinase